MQLIHSIIPFMLATLLSSVHGQAHGPITCDNGKPNNIQASDLTNLASDIQGLIDGGAVSALLDEQTNTQGLSDFFQKFSGSAQVVVQNEFLFATTHLEFANLITAIQEVQSQCCGSFPTCVGGTTKILGDDGLVCDLTIASSDTKVLCC